MRGFRLQFTGALLVILTAAAVLCAIINFQQQGRFRLPDDGVTWVDRQGSVQALHVVGASPADRAGVRPGDAVLSINGAPIGAAVEVAKVLVGLGAWNRARYVVSRGDLEFPATLIVGEAAADPALYYQYLVGAAYLAIGLFVLFRRGNAPKAGHFYVLCLASFVLSTFHYTGKLNSFDRLMYFGNVVAGLLAPAIFVHFCLTFPAVRSRFGSRLGLLLVYAPAALLAAVFFGISSGTLQVAIPLIELRWLLDRVALAFLTAMYLAGAVILMVAQRRAREAIQRQQLKWLRNGALVGIGPFAVFYVAPYLLGAIPGPLARLAVLSLLLIPLTWAWAVIRYRLMDVDIIFQQGYVYTLATLCVLGTFAGVLFSVGRFEELGPTAAAVLILVLAFIFQPIRSWIQEQMDRRVFYKERYDYRRTLIEFARELGAETDLDTTLASAAERLMRTLSISRLAFFLREEASDAFRLEKAAGGEAPEETLDLSFLEVEPRQPHLFFEQTRSPLDPRVGEWPAAVRRTIAALDLTYYLPCAVRGRTIAYLGASRTHAGDFLSSDDLALLVTVSGYLGIAIENARLCRSLQQKMQDYERLKEYSENIVESINVGILAVDFEDRVESWNAQMETLTGLERAEALGRPLAELFPAALIERLAGLEGEQGIHHIYRFPLRRERVSKVIELPVRGSNGRGQAGAAPVPAAPEPPREAIVNIAVAPLVTHELSPIGRLIIFDDVTAREELERRLVQADRLSSIGLLAAGVAHEVNTPLAVISTYAQMLAKQVSGDDQKSRLLEKIAKQTFRASEIVNSLLNFSRVSPTAYDEVSLNRVVQETLGLIEHQMAQCGIRVELDLDEHLPPVRANVGKLQQVFLNLFMNARDAMESGGTLRIRSHGDGGAACVEVLDSGPGIPPEHLPRIFDPFFTTKAGRKGTGLGLSVTYGIVREHGGRIEASSRPGEGTRFWLEFPPARKVAHA
ncbi:MAG: PAS domain S-box protein [Acidobacteria bacterium]|nr:PAS domain S-box protein [Acidobacteriota bacterium]